MPRDSGSSSVATEEAKEATTGLSAERLFEIECAFASSRTLSAGVQLNVVDRP